MESKAFAIEKITEFTPHIADSLRILAKQIGKNYQPLSDNDIKEMIISSTHNLFVVKDTSENKIVGMILVLIYRIPYVRKAYLDDLVIDVDYRKNGLGTLLIQTALEYAKEQGAAYVDFTSRPYRGAGNNLYEKFGFKKRDTNVYRVTFHYGEH